MTIEERVDKLEATVKKIAEILTKMHQANTLKTQALGTIIEKFDALDKQAVKIRDLNRRRS